MHSKPREQPKLERPNQDSVKHTTEPIHKDQNDRPRDSRPSGKPPFQLPSDEELMKLSTDQLKALYSALSGGVERMLLLFKI